MFIELIDLLRCPEDHDESWLVAAFTRMDGRFIREGKLGCPVCSKTYPIVDGVVRFDTREIVDTVSHVSPDDVVRFAAMLGLVKPGSTVVMEGPDTATAVEIAEMTDARVLVMNAAPDSAEAERVGIVCGGNRVPVATGSVDGVLLTGDSSPGLAEASRILRPGGRIVVNAGVAVTPLFRELARDDRHVVGEAVGPLVHLSR